MRLASSSSGAVSVEAARVDRNSLNENKIISLSELWGKSSLAKTVLDNNSPNRPLCSSSLKEEQLRRQHLEKMVHTLQSQLLEYQQRISVAIEVDRSKDAALTEAEQTVQSLNYEVQHLRDAVHRLEADRSESQSRFDALQNELSQAVNLATRFQEKNDKLERELDHCRQDAKQWDERLEQLEMQLNSSKRAEELSHAELNKLRDKFAKVDYQQEKVI